MQGNSLGRVELGYGYRFILASSPRPLFFVEWPPQKKNLPFKICKYSDRQPIGPRETINQHVKPGWEQEVSSCLDGMFLAY